MGKERAKCPNINLNERRKCFLGKKACFEPADTAAIQNLIYIQCTKAMRDGVGFEFTKGGTKNSKNDYE